jgi:hypothetical protein
MSHGQGARDVLRRSCGVLSALAERAHDEQSPPLSNQQVESRRRAGTRSTPRTSWRWEESEARQRTG